MIKKAASGVNKFNSTVTLSTFNNRVFDSEVFGLAKRFQYAPLSVTDIVISPIENGEFPKDEYVWLPIKIHCHGAGSVLIDIYAGTQSDPDGTLWDSTDRPFEKVAHTTVRLNPTIIDIGVKTAVEYEIFAEAGHGVKEDIGGDAETSLIFRPKKTMAYTIRLTNLDTANSGRGHITANWLES